VNPIQMAETEQEDKQGCWLIDSGASHHKTNQKDQLNEFSKKKPVPLGDKKMVEALGKGNVKLKLEHGISEVLKDVMYVRQLLC